MRISIPDQPTKVDSPTGPVLVRPYQLVVPVQLLTQAGLSPKFPAVVDTGHSHNFSISEQQLRDWAQVPPSTLEMTRVIRVNGRPVPVATANLQIDDMRLILPEGIAVFATNHPGVPRLPLIGLRALISNGLTLRISGRTRTASLSKRAWCI